jgi:hypothetical protein
MVDLKDEIPKTVTEKPVKKIVEKVKAIVYKFESTNLFHFINVESQKIEVQFVKGKYETTNKVVADTLEKVQDITKVSEG